MARDDKAADLIQKLMEVVMEVKVICTGPVQAAMATIMLEALMEFLKTEPEAYNEYKECLAELRKAIPMEKLLAGMKKMEPHPKWSDIFN